MLKILKILSTLNDMIGCAAPWQDYLTSIVIFEQKERKSLRHKKLNKNGQKLYLDGNHISRCFNFIFSIEFKCIFRRSTLIIKKLWSIFQISLFYSKSIIADFLKNFSLKLQIISNLSSFLLHIEIDIYWYENSTWN
jgi:hypothetical protein